MENKLDAKKIGERLAELRAATGKSLSEVAEDLDITKSALSNYEQGLRVPRDTIKIRIAKYYKKSISTIFLPKMLTIRE